jgi:quinol monooxygenase YgiN
VSSSIFPIDLLRAEVAVVVLYRTKPGCRDRFLRLARDHARKVLESEPGCILYAVADFGEGRLDLVIFTEAYSSLGAFDSHQSGATLAVFREARASFIEGFSHRVYHAVPPSSQAEARGRS